MNREREGMRKEGELGNRLGHDLDHREWEREDEGTINVEKRE